MAAAGVEEEAPVPAPAPALVPAPVVAAVVAAVEAVLAVLLPPVAVRVRLATEAAHLAEALGSPHPTAAAGMIPAILLTAQPLAPLGVVVVVDLRGPGCGKQALAVAARRPPRRKTKSP